MYALPHQILPCADVDFPDLWYLNTDFAPVKYPFKDNFNIESYNNTWLDSMSIMSKPDLRVEMIFFRTVLLLSTFLGPNQLHLPQTLS